MRWSDKVAPMLLGVLAAGMMSCGISDKEEMKRPNSPTMTVALYKDGSAGNVKLVLENVSRMQLVVLTWNMPTIEGRIESDVFDVAKCSGETLPYKGRMVSKVAVGVHDVLHLRPGERVAKSIKVTDYYDLREVDCYIARYNSCLQHRAFKSEEDAIDFLRKFRKAPTVEELNLIECIKSNTLKYEGGN
jgi:hypothetical protein